MLPAIPTKASKQDRSPATQGSVARDKQASSDAQGSVARGKQASSGAQGYLSLALDMVKSSGIYALGALASPLISLVLTPFLAHHLSPTDYGALSLLYTVIDLVTLITQLGVSSAFFRAYNSDFFFVHFSKESVCESIFGSIRRAAQQKIPAVPQSA